MGVSIMKKFVLLLVSVFLIQGASFAKDILQFDFPDKGWHQVESPDKSKYKKCYVPYNQTAQNYTEMLIWTERYVCKDDHSSIIYNNEKYL